MLVREWTDEEEKFLIRNYPKYGAKYCSDKLNRTIVGIRVRAKLLKVKYKRVKEIYHEENLRKIVYLSTNIGDVLDRLDLRRAGGNYKVINDYIKKYNLDTSHFDDQKFKIGQSPKNKIPLSDVLIDGSEYSRNSLKKRLYDEGLLERKCCLCGQDENWNEMKISLILDHKNGVHNDNRIENLRIVCPNCNAGLDTFAGRNSKREKKERNVKEDSQKVKSKIKYRYTDGCECGNSKLKSSKKCEDCFHKERRKIERPPLKQLMKDVDEFGFSATGRKYGVSDNAIRKWIKSQILEQFKIKE